MRPVRTYLMMKAVLTTDSIATERNSVMRQMAALLAVIPVTQVKHVMKKLIHVEEPAQLM
jgi:hypothetical protein